MLHKNPNLSFAVIDVYTKFNQICPSVLKILSRNDILTSTKGRRNSVTNMQKMMINNPTLDILSGNKILISIKGCNSVTNVQKMMVSNPNLDLVIMNVYTKFVQILSI